MNFLKRFFISKKIKKSLDNYEQKIINDRKKLKYNSRTINFENVNSIQVVMGKDINHYARITYRNIKKAIIVLIED